MINADVSGARYIGFQPSSGSNSVPASVVEYDLTGSQKLLQSPSSLESFALPESLPLKPRFIFGYRNIGKVCDTKFGLLVPLIHRVYGFG